jgi:putative ATP-binding cassette transporter
MKLLTFLLRKSKSIVVLSILAGILSGAASAGLIVLINTALNHKESSAMILVWSFTGLCVLLPVMRFFAGVLLAKLGQRVIFDLRLHLCGRILSAPLRRLEEIGVPRLLASLTDDVLVISNTLTSIPLLCIHLAIVIGCLIYLVWLSWTVFLVVVILLALGVASIQLLERKARGFFKLAREEQDALFSHFRALTEGIKELKLHRRRREVLVSQLIQSTATSYQLQNVAGVTVYSAAGSWAQFLFFSLIGFLLFVLPTLTPIKAHIPTSYVLTLVYMMVPLEGIISMLPNLARANVALRKIMSLGLSLASRSTEDVSTPLPESQPSWKQLELVGVTHTYCQERDGSSFTLGPVDLTFSPGELVFLVGGNGSGKTTLAKLLTGLYIPETGEIRFDGQPVTDNNREHYRQNFSTIFSDFYLFESLLGLDKPELDAQAQDYLDLLQLAHKVQVKNGVLSTIELSHGQRKRLALLTAFLEDRPIYVFDEWAADQEPLFREVFYLRLLPELKARGKMVLVISHDDRYFHLADRIIKLDYGRLEYVRSLAPSPPSPSAPAQLPPRPSSLSGFTRMDL